MFWVIILNDSLEIVKIVLKLKCLETFLRLRNFYFILLPKKKWLFNKSIAAQIKENISKNKWFHNNRNVSTSFSEKIIWKIRYIYYIKKRRKNLSYRAHKFIGDLKCESEANKSIEAIYVLVCSLFVRRLSHSFMSWKKL